MRKIIIIISCISFFTCNTNKIEKPKKPDNLLSKNKMVDVLYDLALFNASKGINKKVLENKGVNPEDYVYQKHNIDSLSFEESNNYYTYNSEVYHDIYEKVRLRLANKKKTYKAILDFEKKERDSLAKKARKNKDSLLRVRKSGDKADPYFVRSKSKNPSKNEEQLKQ